MEHHRVKKTFKTTFSNPIVLNIGDIVTLIEEETEEKWKGWISVETSTNKGWIPKQIIEILDNNKTGKILEFYSAKELNVEEGDLIGKIKSLNGWTWSININTKEEGWLPDENIT